ncbi:DNA-directed RNA polymerase subunit alpha [Frankliniella fusca]|uniref:DNA-directed RNA polymerase subunit alpha n=1 Tax=Frankliniella fusca TaxID=407009 RepID=A0AAE1I2S6_9NEOP|nr:DNA-directed RNA polymerase subunit alpha [Frankliniella fusca]
MSVNSFKACFPHVQCTTLAALTGPVQNAREATLNVNQNNAILQLRIVTVNHTIQFKPFLGRDWLDVLWPNWRLSVNNFQSIQSINPTAIPTLDQIKTMFSRPFATNSDTCIDDFTVKLEL